MEEIDRDNAGEGAAECLRRCEETFERCESSGVAYRDCNEIHSGCITGCDSTLPTS